MDFSLGLFSMKESTTEGLPIQDSPRDTVVKKAVNEYRKKLVRDMERREASLKRLHSKLENDKMEFQICQKF